MTLPFVAAPLCLAQGDTFAAVAAAVGTDFAQWSEAEVRAFLEQRGEDYDDCRDMQALVSTPHPARPVVPSICAGGKSKDRFAAGMFAAAGGNATVMA